MRTENGSYKHRWKGTWILSFALLVVALDNTILNVALPAISNALSASAKDIQWIVDIYMLIFASLLLTFGSLSDRYGRRLLLNAGIFIFALASLGAALSTSVEMLIWMRGISGLGGAMMMPSTLSIMTDMFKDPDERMKAIAAWSASFGVGAGIGPIIGGLLIDNYSWEMVFYINVPIAIVSIVLSYIYLPESKSENPKRADILGMMLSIVAIFALIYAIIEAGVVGWSDTTVIQYFIVATVLMAIFIMYERKIDHAMLPLMLFKNPSFMIASAALTLAMFGMMGTMYFFSQYFQTIHGYSALESGSMLIPLTVGMIISSGLSPRLIKKFGTKGTVTGGMVVVALSMFYFGSETEVDSSVVAIMTGFVLLGLGLGVAMMPITNSIMGSIPDSRMGEGSAMNNTTRQLGGALSIAVMGTLMNSAYIDYIKTNLTTLPQPLVDGVSSSIQAAHGIASKMGDVMAPDIIKIADEAFVLGMQNAMYAAMAVSIFAAILVYLKLPNEIVKSEED